MVSKEPFFPVFIPSVPVLKLVQVTEMRASLSLSKTSLIAMFLLLRIREVLGSNVGLETGYLD
jgi:hypothetical protein